MNGGYQVHLMGNIYERARSVIIDLGEPDASSDKVLGYLAGKTPYSPGSRALLVVEYAALMERRYWRRVWILQEITLSSAANVICGRHTRPPFAT